MPHGNIVGVDLLMIQLMVATVTDHAGQPELWRRYPRLLLDGMRAASSTPEGRARKAAGNLYRLQGRRLTVVFDLRQSGPVPCSRPSIGRRERSSSQLRCHCLAAQR
jgi:hypothetical protein